MRIVVCGSAEPTASCSSTSVDTLMTVPVGGGRGGALSGEAARTTVDTARHAITHGMTERGRIIWIPQDSRLPVGEHACSQEKDTRGDGSESCLRRAGLKAARCWVGP